MKKDVSLIVSGAGWIGGFTDKLIRALRVRGVTDEQIHRLVTDEGEVPVGIIADAIAEYLVPPLASAELDTDALPNLPSGFNLTDKGTKHRGMGKVKVEKRRDGQLYVNGIRVVRYLSPNQKDGNVIDGHKLRLELEKEDEPSCLNATFRNFLLANTEFIPDDWSEGYTYFWDTISANSNGCLYVACLCRRVLGWIGSWDWLDNDWNSSKPAARLAKKALGH